MIITKKAKRPYSYIQGVKNKLIKKVQKGHYDKRIGENDWYKVREMLKGDIYFNVIMSDFSYFTVAVKAL